MDNQDFDNRAQQFSAFAALRGFSEMIEGKTCFKEEKKELSPDQIENLSYQLQSLHLGDRVSVLFYHHMKYERITGSVTDLNVCGQILKVGKMPIRFDDLYRIDLL